MPYRQVYLSLYKAGTGVGSCRRSSDPAGNRGCNLIISEDKNMSREDADARHHADPQTQNRTDRRVCLHDRHDRR